MGPDLQKETANKNPTLSDRRPRKREGRINTDPLAGIYSGQNEKKNRRNRKIQPFQSSTLKPSAIRSTSQRLQESLRCARRRDRVPSPVSLARSRGGEEKKARKRWVLGRHPKNPVGWAPLWRRVNAQRLIKSALPWTWRDPVQDDRFTQTKQTRFESKKELGFQFLAFTMASLSAIS